MKRKLIIASITLLILAMSGIISYWRVATKQRGSADVRDLIQIKNWITGAGAFHGPTFMTPGNYPDDNSLYFKSNKILKIVAEDFNATLNYRIQDGKLCLKEFKKKYPSPASLPIPDPVTGDVYIEMSGCTIVFLKPKKNEKSYNAIVSARGTGYKLGSFISLFKDASNDTDRSEELIFDSEATILYDYAFNFSQSGWDIKFSDKDHPIRTSSGYANFPFKIGLTGKEDFGSELKRWADSYLLEIDPASYWRVSTDGKLEGKIFGSWFFEKDNDNQYKETYDIEEIEFCPEVCKISIEEELDIKAKLKQWYPRAPSGDLWSYAHHKELYEGVGAGDPKNSSLYWTQLKLDKEDAREWSRNLDHPDLGKSSYMGKVFTKSENYPLENDKYSAKTVAVKNLKINLPATLVPVPMNTYQEVDIDKTITNQNGSVNITGIGTKSTGDGKTISKTIKGPFTDDDPDGSTILVSEPLDMKDQKYDLFKDVPQEYIKSYFPNTLVVPGFFTASDNNGVKRTAIGTRPLKSIPKDVVLIETYLPGDKAFPVEIVNKMHDFTALLSSKGARIYPHKATTKKYLIDIFKRIPDNSWVLILGHGSPDGLSAGKEHLSYQEIYWETWNKRIDVLGGHTCYLGRAPIGQTVIGSMGVGFSQDNLGSLFGIGSNAWNLSADDLIRQLKEIIGCNKS